MMRFVRAVLPQMIERHASKIIAVTSAAPLRTIPNSGAYSAAEARRTPTSARSALRSPARHNIQLNAIAQAYVESVDAFQRDTWDTDTIRRQLRHVPAGRSAESWEQTEPVAFLASASSDFIAGQVIPYTGGWATNTYQTPARRCQAGLAVKRSPSSLDLARQGAAKMSIVSASLPPPATPPTWVTWREAVTVVTYPRHLKKTVLIALFVGTLLFCINQLDIVLRGDATTTLWIKAAVTYLVPFCVSSAGVLVASHRTPSTGDDSTGPDSDRQPSPPNTSETQT